MTAEERRARRAFTRSDRFSETFERLRTSGQETIDREQSGLIRRGLRGLSQGWDIDRLDGNGAIFRRESALLTAMTMPESERRNRLQDYGEGSRLVGLVNGTTERDRRALTSRHQELFGDTKNLQGVAMAMRQAVAPTSMEAGTGVGFAMNAAFRGGVNILTGGLIDPGNMAAGQGGVSATRLREAYVTQMVQSGQMTREQATSNFERNGSAITQAALSRSMAFMSPEQRERIRAAGRGGFDRGGTGEAVVRGAAQQEREGANRILGRDSSNADNEAFVRETADIRGVGRNDSQRAESQRFIMAAANMMAVAQSDPTRANQLESQVNQMEQQLRRHGFSARDIESMRSTAEGMSGQIRGDTARLDRAQRFTRRQRDASGVQVLNAMESGVGMIREAQTVKNFASGVTALQGGSTVMSDVLNGLGEGASETEIMSRVRGMSRTQLDALRRQNPALARAIESGDAGAIREQVAKQGERRERVRQDIDHSIVGRVTNSLFGSGTASRLADLTGITSLADRRAEQQQNQVNQTEDQAGAAGIGGASDQLVTASQELRQAAQLMRDTVQGRGLDGMLTPGGN